MRSRNKPIELIAYRGWLHYYTFRPTADGGRMIFWALVALCVVALLVWLLPEPPR